MADFKKPLALSGFNSNYNLAETLFGITWITAQNSQSWPKI
jgi:hypothetical protein